MAGASGTFRIFVSSTFDDLRAERNALQRYVFPRLHELCASKGASFQEIDLRWGVNDEASFDQRAMPICLGEIDRCLETTPKPNFIALLGDRYGWRPLPYEIPADELEAMQFDSDEQVQIDAWYRKDENAKPATYVLRPRVGEYATRKGGPWHDEVEPALQRALTRASEGLAPAAREKYLASATAQEIAHATRVAKPRDHVFAFFRQIKIAGMPLAEALPADASADKYVDLLPGRARDTDAETRLADLKTRLASDFEACWYEDAWNPDVPAEDGRVREDPNALGAPTHTRLGSLPDDLDSCLALVHDPDGGGTLCVDVWHALAKAILDELETAELQPLSESDLHRAFATARSREFVGRADVLARIARYVERGEEERLLAISGDAGSGKTTLLARAFLDAAPAHPEATVIARFIGGATPGSSDVRSLLAELSKELAVLAGSEEDVPAEYHKLVAHFSAVLEQAAAVKPIILFLDALDQLSDAYAARNLAWLPAKLPEGVRIVVSTRSSERRPAREGEARQTRPAETLVALQRKYPEPALVDLEEMTRPEAEELLRLWLYGVGRTLTPSQWEHVLECFDATGMPLHLRLAFEEARLWHSYDDIPKRLGCSIEGLIRDNLLDRLDDPQFHDTMVVERSLGYLTASRYGLAEDELIALLSRDDKLYAHISESAWHELPEVVADLDRRLPVVLWSRLSFDLAPYLTRRASEGVDVLGFYHRELTEVARSMYLDGDRRPRERHCALASYFHDRADPRRDREWKGYPRGLAELPFHLTEAARTDADMRDELFKVLTDFRFIERKVADVGVVRGVDPDGAETVTHSGAFLLQEDYDTALELFPGQTGEPGLGPLIVTARDRDGDLTVFCPACANESPIDAGRLGEVEPCPECGRKLRLNTFTITPAWT